jgi:hypothetical protein
VQAREREKREGEGEKRSEYERARERGRERARRRGGIYASRVVLNIAGLHGFRVVCAQRWAGPPYRCSGSKLIISANENAGLPAPVNVYDYEDSRAKRSHLSRLEGGSADSRGITQR